MDTKSLQAFMADYNQGEIGKILVDANFKAEDFLKLQSIISGMNLVINAAKEYRVKYCKDEALKKIKTSSKNQQKNINATKKNEQNENKKSQPVTSNFQSVFGTVPSHVDNKY